MVRSPLVGLLFEAWNDIDRVVDGVSTEEALRQDGGGSAYAWTYAHMGNSMDTWINVRLRELAPHPYLGQERFHNGGPGSAEDWNRIRAGVGEVRERLREYLGGMDDTQLAAVAVRGLTFSGALASLGKRSVSCRYAILRLCAHHYYHIGEIATKRDLQGAKVGDYPCALEQCV